MATVSSGDLVWRTGSMLSSSVRTGEILRTGLILDCMILSPGGQPSIGPQVTTLVDNCGDHLPDAGKATPVRLIDGCGDISLFVACGELILTLVAVGGDPGVCNTVRQVRSIGELLLGRSSVREFGGE